MRDVTCKARGEITWGLDCAFGKLHHQSVLAEQEVANKKGNCKGQSLNVYRLNYDCLTRSISSIPESGERSVPRRNEAQARLILCTCLRKENQRGGQARCICENAVGTFSASLIPSICPAYAVPRNKAVANVHIPFMVLLLASGDLQTSSSWTSWSAG